MDSAALPPWYGTLRADDPALAADIARQLYRLPRGPSLGEDGADAPAQLAWLSGEDTAQLRRCAVEACLRQGFLPPLVEPASRNWTPEERRAAAEDLWRCVAETDAHGAEELAVKAVGLGSLQPEILYAHARFRFRHGAFEELLALPKTERSGGMKRLMARVAQDAQLLRFGFAMPSEADREPLADADEKKVLYLLHTCLPYASVDYATRSQGLLKGLSETGFAVEGVTRLGFPHNRFELSDGASPPERVEVDGVRYRHLPDAERGRGARPPIDYLKANILAHMPLVRGERPAILHAASNHVGGIAATFLARKFGLSSIYEVRGLWEVTRASREPSYAASDSFRQWVRLETEAARNADRVLCVTNGVRDEMVRRGVDPARIVVVPNGVDAARLMPRPRDADLARAIGLGEGKVVVGYVGSILPYEGIDDLVWACKRLRDLGRDDVQALIVGDGEALPPVRALIARLGLGEVVFATGRVPHDDVARYYSLIDIAAFPRLPLPVCEMVSPLKPLEAMAMRKCVVVSSVAALSEMVEPGVTGLVFGKGDAEDLVAVLARLAGDALLRERIAAQARDWVERERDWKRLARIVADIYGELNAERAAKAGVSTSGAARQAAGPAPSAETAYLYGFFGTNVGDGAVTQGAVALTREAGAGPSGIVAAPLTASGRKAWEQTERLLPGLAVHELPLGSQSEPAGGPAAFLDAVRSDAAVRRDLLERNGAVHARRVVYCGGEHLFADGTEGSDARLMSRLAPVLAGLREGLPTVFLPTTFGPFRSPFSVGLAREVLAGAQAVAVRDARSGAEVAALGLPAPPVLLDAAFFLPSGGPALPAHQARVDRRLVSLVMRLDGFGMRVGAEMSGRRVGELEAGGYALSRSFSLYRDIGAALLRASLDLRLFIQCHADDRPTRLLADELSRAFPGRRILVNKPANAQAMVRDLSTGAATVTSRFHAAIFSMMSGCPAVGIYFGEHGHETPGLFELFDAGTRCFDGHAAPADAIAAAAMGSIAGRDALEAEIDAKTARLREETLAAYRPCFR